MKKMNKINGFFNTGNLIIVDNVNFDDILQVYVVNFSIYRAYEYTRKIRNQFEIRILKGYFEISPDTPYIINFQNNLERKRDEFYKIDRTKEFIVNNFLTFYNSAGFERYQKYISYKIFFNNERKFSVIATNIDKDKFVSKIKQIIDGIPDLNYLNINNDNILGDDKNKSEFMFYSPYSDFNLKL